MTRSWRSAAVAVVLALGVFGCGGEPSPAGAGAFTVDCPTALASWPTTPPAPADAPPDLPADRAVGRGVLVLRTCSECGARLLTESGEVYTLPPIAMPPVVVTPTETPGAPPIEVPNEPLDPMHGVRLSPDGRWLARPKVGGAVRLRELTSSRALVLDGSSDDLVWSDDGRWLVASPHQPTVLWDLDTGTQRPVKAVAPYQDWLIAGVFGPDEVLLTQPYDQERRDADRRHETYVTVDPGTGDVRHEYDMDFGDDGEGLVQARLIVNVTDSSEGRPSEVVVSDLVEGTVVGRYPLPAETPARFTFWGAARTPGDGILLVRDYSWYEPPLHAEPIQLFMLDRATGERRLACTLPPRTEFVIRR